MEKTRKIQCSECNIVCHLPESLIPKDAQQGEGIPFDCPICQRLTYGILLGKNKHLQRADVLNDK